jgi:Flp pilus assembly pilin Flp
VRPLISRLLCDESGQDLIEYVLLTATLGLAGIATWPLIEASIFQTYTTLDNDTQNLWIPPAPSGGGS